MLLSVAGLTLTILMASPATPVYPPSATQADAPGLRSATAWVCGLSEEALIRLVPVRSGLYFVGCPNCTGGRQEGQLAWTTERPDEVYCRYCGYRYPGTKYPMRGAVAVRNPRGETQTYPYWEDGRGYRYFFEARRDDLVREYLENQARSLALLYALTGERPFARRAALLLDRFAQVFPGYCYHYDYPFQQKEISDGDVPPASFRRDYRTARWTWWAYMDNPLLLIEAYDWIRSSGELEKLSRERGLDVAARIERDMFRSAAEQTLANPEPYTNMSPTLWRSIIVLGRVIGEPRYIHEPVRRLRRFTQERFFYDGTWPEGAPSYQAQTVGNLDIVLRVSQGYSDPQGYKDPADGSCFSRLDLAADIPSLRAARETLRSMRFPDGRLVPVHDTWWSDRAEPLPSTHPFLLPALGHACLGGGARTEQTQLHVTWSGGYGHQHADSLSLNLFAAGREMLSDLGYSHTRYRSWTLATAAHNTVVIDGESQAFGSKTQPSDGTLRWFDVSDPRVQTVGADGARCYPGKASTYRRSLVLIDAPAGQRYAVDLFEVEGGKVHDYFLHGDADAPGAVSANVALEPRASLLPADLKWKPTENEGEAGRASERHYAYGFLRNLQEAPAPAGKPLSVTFSPVAAGTPSLRVSLLPEPDSRLFVGQNPSIRGAGESDQRLDQALRPFLLLRHEGAQGRSAFAAVLEPYRASPFLTSVKRHYVRGAVLVLEVRLAERTDWIVIGAQQPAGIPTGRWKACFQGEVGVLSLRGGKVEHAYALGGDGWTARGSRYPASRLRRSALRAIAGHDLVVAGGSRSLPCAGGIVRMLTDDGWCYPFTVVAARRDGAAMRVQVLEGPGMTYDHARRALHLTAFPQREHSGAVRLEWYAR